jgi:NADPH:quinone reductase-like Zn-dependent oxidoreductase
VTAHQLLARTSAVGAGSRVLVYGGAGGVGSALLQLARLRGISVYATASAGKHEFIRSLGAHPIDYRAQDVAKALRRTSPDGVDAVYDPIGGASWGRSFSLLRPGGVLVLYGFRAGQPNGTRSLLGTGIALLRTPWASFMRLQMRSTGVIGYAITDVLRAHPEWLRTDLSELVTLYADGKIDPMIAARIPLERAAEAHRMLTGERPVGKIVLETTSTGTGRGEVPR